MALIKESNLREIADQEIKKDASYSSINREMIKKALLLESSEQFTEEKHFDIFLSHSFLDKDLILGLSKLFERYGYSVYIDWIEDSDLDRKNVTVKNVKILKQRMSSSKCLVYATSKNTSQSKWMPWELGFMDSFTNKVAICPIVSSYRINYIGIEYLSIYPYIDEIAEKNSDANTLWVTGQETRNNYTKFSNWISGGDLTIHE